MVNTSKYLAFIWIEGAWLHYTGYIEVVVEFSSSMLTASSNPPSETTITLFSGAVWRWGVTLKDAGVHHCGWQNRVLTCKWHGGSLWSPLVGVAGGGSRVGAVDGPDCDRWCWNVFRYWPEPVDCTASYQEKCTMKARQYAPSILLPKVTCGPLPLLLHMSMCRELSIWIYLSKPH